MNTIFKKISVKNLFLLWILDFKVGSYELWNWNANIFRIQIFVVNQWKFIKFDRLSEIYWKYFHNKRCFSASINISILCPHFTTTSKFRVQLKTFIIWQLFLQLCDFSKNFILSVTSRTVGDQQQFWQNDYM